jgi:hypothetical protein
MLIARQKPQATNVAGIRTWNSLGRFVKRGEKGILILAPMIGRKKTNGEAEPTADAKESPVQQLYGFRAVYVFDRLSRDLWPSPCALDVIRECHFRKSLDSSTHIIAQPLCPAQHSLMRGWFTSCPSGLKPTRQNARVCSAAAMFRTVE